MDYARLEHSVEDEGAGHCACLKTALSESDGSQQRNAPQEQDDPAEDSPGGESGYRLENRFRDLRVLVHTWFLSCPLTEDAGTVAKTAHAPCKLFAAAFPLTHRLCTDLPIDKRVEVVALDDLPATEFTGMQTAGTRRDLTLHGCCLQ